MEVTAMWHLWSKTVHIHYFTRNETKQWKSRQYKKMMTVMIIITNQMKMGVICQPQQSTTTKNYWRKPDKCWLHCVTVLKRKLLIKALYFLRVAANQKVFLYVYSVCMAIEYREWTLLVENESIVFFSIVFDNMAKRRHTKHVRYYIAFAFLKKRNDSSKVTNYFTFRPNR